MGEEQRRPDCCTPLLSCAADAVPKLRTEKCVKAFLQQPSPAQKTFSFFACRVDGASVTEVRSVTSKLTRLDFG